jgi:hypothetical protein
MIREEHTMVRKEQKLFVNEISRKKIFSTHAV